MNGNADRLCAGSPRPMGASSWTCSATRFSTPASPRSASTKTAPSGRKDHRPGPRRLPSRRCSRGNTFVVWKLDRLRRDLKHLVSTVDELRARGVGLRVLAGAEIDTTTAERASGVRDLRGAGFGCRPTAARNRVRSSAVRYFLPRASTSSPPVPGFTLGFSRRRSSVRLQSTSSAPPAAKSPRGRRSLASSRSSAGGEPRQRVQATPCGALGVGLDVLGQSCGRIGDVPAAGARVGVAVVSTSGVDCHGVP